MKRLGLVLIGVMLALAGFAAADVTIGGASGRAADDSKITICHAASAVNNPYVVETPSKNSIANVDGAINGHGLHVGPVFPAPGWGDIIPPFEAGSKTGNNGKLTDEWGAFGGLNWTDAGRAIYDAGCKALTPETTATTTTTHPTTTTVPTSTTTPTTTTVPTSTTTPTTTTTPATSSVEGTTTAVTSTSSTTTTPATIDTTTTTPPTTSTTAGVAGTTTTSTLPPTSGVAGAATPSTPATKQTLPYTGASDWALALSGVLALVLGLGLRRLGKET